MKLSPKLLSGLSAIGIYLFIVGAVFYYFGYRNDDKPKHYVAKNSNAISVSLAGSSSHTKHHTQPKKKVTKKRIKHPKPKPANKKIAPKKPAKKVIKKLTKKKIVKKIKKPTKKIDTKNLFSKVKTKPKTTKPSIKKISKNSPKNNKKTGKSTIKDSKQADKGIEDKYLASVQDKLYGWPTQSNFAGSMVVIGISIRPNGMFEYEILQGSGNVDFDRTIKQYLDQLKTIGLGATPGGRSYKYKVEIKAR